MQTPLDVSLFRWIHSETIEGDRQALLSIREAVCSTTPVYRYLEVGSHLGGSLQPHVVDARCVRIYSIDPRPLEQPDEACTSKFKYEGNSTDRMLSLLAKIPGANISNIQTFEACSWELAPGSVAPPVDFAFIDGEHTNSAVLRDFIAVRRFLAPVAVLAFHDCFVTPGAFFKIARMLRGVGSQLLYFPGSYVVAIAYGSVPLKEALVNFGWQEGLPYSHIQIIENHVRKRFPRMFSLLKRCRDRVRGKQDA